MIKAAAARGWLDERRAALEALSGHRPRRRRHDHHLLRQAPWLAMATVSAPVTTARSERLFAERHR